MPKVYNKHHKDAPLDAIYVGRPTKWGNPYVVGKHSRPGGPLTRGEAVEAYRIHILNSAPLQAAAQIELKGKNLVCYCAPKPCHADILLEIANS